MFFGLHLQFLILDYYYYTHHVFSIIINSAQLRIALPCTPRTCLLHLNNPSPMILKGWTYPGVCPKGKVTEKTEPCIN